MQQELMESEDYEDIWDRKRNPEAGVNNSKYLELKEILANLNMTPDIKFIFSEFPFRT